MGPRLTKTLGAKCCCLRLGHDSFIYIHYGLEVFALGTLIVLCSNTGCRTTRGDRIFRLRCCDAFLACHVQWRLVEP